MSALVLTLLLSSISPQQIHEVVAPETRDQLIALDLKLAEKQKDVEDEDQLRAILDTRRVIWDILNDPSTARTVQDIGEAIGSASKVLSKLW